MGGNGGAEPGSDGRWQPEVECVLLRRVTSGESTFTLELPYRRSVGPVVGAFLTGLRDQQRRSAAAPPAGG